MLTKTMDDTDGFGGIGRSELGMIESDLFFLSVKIGFVDRVMLLLGLSDELLVHGLLYLSFIFYSQYL